jgi:amino acid transporter
MAGKSEQAAGRTVAGVAPVSTGSLFARTSSGLVRTVSTFDTFFYAINGQAPQLAFFGFAVLAFYKGVSWTGGILLTAAAGLFLAVTYGLFAGAYPRSGAEYVPLSRVLHPLIGFLVNLALVLNCLICMGFDGALTISMGWSPLMLVIGTQLGNESLVQLGRWADTPVGWILLGLVLIAGVSVVLYRGMSLFFRVQRWALGVGLLGFVVMIVVLGLGGAGVFDFQAGFDQFGGAGAFEKVLAAARADGVLGNVPVDWRSTLNFMIWPATVFTLVGMSTSFSGEVKNVSRGQLIALPAAIVTSTVLVVLMGQFGISALTRDGALAISYVSGTYPDLFPLAYPWLPTLAAILANNVVLSAVILGSIMLLYVMIEFAIAVYATRCMLAWAIDGIAPSWLGVVSERFHTPVNAVIANAVIAVVFLVLYTFIPWMWVISFQFIICVGFVILCIAGALFPFLKRDVYQASAARIEFGGIPLITISGVLGAIGMAWIAYRTAVDEVLRAINPVSLSVLAFVLIGGTAWYIVAVAARRRQGVDMAARFREIPIE